MPYTSTPRIRGVSAGGSPSPSYKGGSAILVAASDAPALIKNRADYVCSGTDDQVTIQTALNSRRAVQTDNIRLLEDLTNRLLEDLTDRLLENSVYYGVKVILSIGTFHFSNSLYLYNGDMLEGSGWDTILRQKDNSDHYSMIRFEAGARFILIQNFQLDGNGVNNEWDNYDDMWNANTTIYNQGIIPNIDNSDIILNNLYLHDTTRNLLVVKGTRIKAFNLHATRSWWDHCIYHSGARDCLISNFLADTVINRSNSSQTVVKFGTNVGRSEARNCKLVNGEIKSSKSGIAAHFVSGNNNTISNVTMNDNYIGVRISTWSRDIIISDCHITNVDSHGIEVLGDNCIIDSNKILNSNIERASISSGGSGIYANQISKLSITNNHIQNTNYGPAVLLNDSSDCIITDNQLNRNKILSSSQTYGVYENGLSDYNIIKDNNVRNNTLGGVLKAGSNSIVKDNMGHKNENSGYQAISSGETSITVSHGLDSVNATSPISMNYPKIMLTPATKLENISHYYVSNITTTTFDITIEYFDVELLESSGELYSGSMAFHWKAEI